MIILLAALSTLHNCPTNTGGDEDTAYQVTINAPAGWYGWGIDFWDFNLDQQDPADISGYTDLVLSIASSDAALTDTQIGMISGSNEVWVDASAYGYVNDGNWHELIIALTVFSGGGVDLANVIYVFANRHAAGIIPVGAVYNVDEIY